MQTNTKDDNTKHDNTKQKLEKYKLEEKNQSSIKYYRNEFAKIIKELCLPDDIKKVIYDNGWHDPPVPLRHMWGAFHTIEDMRVPKQIDFNTVFTALKDFERLWKQKIKKKYEKFSIVCNPVTMYLTWLTVHSINSINKLKRTEKFYDRKETTPILRKYFYTILAANTNNDKIAEKVAEKIYAFAISNPFEAPMFAGMLYLFDKNIASKYVNKLKQFLKKRRDKSKDILQLFSDKETDGKMKILNSTLKENENNKKTESDDRNKTKEVVKNILWRNKF